MDDAQRARHQAALEALRAGRPWDAAPALQTLAEELDDDAEVWCDFGNAAQDYNWMQDARKAYERARELGGARADWELGSMLIDDEPAVARPLLERCAAYQGKEPRACRWAFESQRMLAPDDAAREEVLTRQLSWLEREVGPGSWLGDALAEYGVTLAAQDRRDPARTALQRSFEVYQEVLGPSHPSTVAQLHLLAAQMQVWDEDGEPLLRAHLDKVDTHGASLVWVKLKDYLWPVRLDDALAAFGQALVLEEQAFGFCHPATDRLRGWIRDNYEYLERKTDALRIQRESAERAEKQLGLAHQDTFTLYSWLARWSDERRIPILRALAKRQEKALRNHPAVLRTLDELYDASYQENRLELIEQTLAMREAIYGRDGIELFETLYRKTSEIIKQRSSDFREQALLLWQRLFELWEKSPFHEYDEVPAAISIGAGWLEEHEKRARWQRIVSICEDAFGKRHKVTAAARIPLGEVLAEEDPEAAQRELEAGREAIEEGPREVEAIRSLARFHSDKKDYDGAIRLREEVVQASPEERRPYALRELSMELASAGRVDRALHTLSDAVALTVEKEPQTAAGYHLDAARLLENAHRLAEGMGFVRSAAALLPRIEDRDGRCTVARSAGGLALANQDFQEAHGYLEQALSSCEEREKDGILDDLIECASALDQLDRALGWYAQRAKSLPKVLFPLVRSALGKRKKGALDEACVLFDQVLELAKKQRQRYYLELLRTGRDLVRREHKRQPKKKPSSKARAAAPPRRRAPKKKSAPKKKGRR